MCCTLTELLFLFPSGSAAKQAVRKQQLRTWKLQQQRDQEEKRRQEEEERRKREDEIRRIRNLSNQDEQYNRFMKLVGGKTRMRSKVRAPSIVWLLLQMCVLWRTEVSSVLQSTDREHRKSAGKQGVDASGNLYQYDNYDEVAMDTDSETGSPGDDSPELSLFRWNMCAAFTVLTCFRVSVPSPTHAQLPADEPGCLTQLTQFGMVRLPRNSRSGSTMCPRIRVSTCFFLLSGLLSAVPLPDAVRCSSPASASPASTRRAGSSSQTSLR